MIATIDGQRATVRAGLPGDPTITVEFVSSEAFAASLEPARIGLLGRVALR